MSHLTQAREMTSAIDRNRLSSHPSRLFRRQEHDQRGDFIRLTGSAEWMRLLRTIEKRSVLRFVHPTAAMEVRHRDAGVHRVDANAVRCHFERCAACQMIQA